MRPRPSTGSASVRTVAVSLAAAAAIFGGLAVQMAHGHDPALGAGTTTAQTSGSSGGSASDDSSGGGSFGDDSSGGTLGQSSGGGSGVVTRAS
jgi:hypothetical protein